MATLDFGKLAKQLLERIPTNEADRVWAENVVRGVSTSEGKLDVFALMQALGQKFTEGLGAHPELVQIAMSTPDLANALIAIGEDAQKTLKAASEETDPNRLEALVFDLEQTLPARRAAIVSSVASRAGAASKAALEAGLDFMAHVGVAVAKALVAHVI